MISDFFAGIVAIVCSVFLLFACVVFVGFLLSGCATAPPQPQIVDHATPPPPQLVPVPVPCMKAEQIPPKPQTAIRQEFSGEKTELAMAVDLRELDRYIIKTQSLMWGCVEALEGK